MVAAKPPELPWCFTVFRFFFFRGFRSTVQGSRKDPDSGPVGPGLESRACELIRFPEFAGLGFGVWGLGSHHHPSIGALKPYALDP